MLSYTGSSIIPSILVAIWNNEVRLPLDVELDNGRLLANRQDDPGRDFDDWDPIDVFISEFLRTAARQVRARR